MCVAVCFNEVCTLGALTTAGSTKHEEDFGVSFKGDSRNWHSLLSHVPDSGGILGTINLDDKLSLLVHRYD